MAVDPYVLWHFQELFKRTGWIAGKQLEAEARLSSIEGRLDAIETNLSAIAAHLDAIQQQLSSLDDRPTTRIEKIEYRFEQLKVDTLSGSLQIGMTHGAEGLIEDLEAGGLTAQNVELTPNSTDSSSDNGSGASGGGSGSDDGGSVSSSGSSDGSLARNPYGAAMRAMQLYLGAGLYEDINAAAAEAGVELDADLRGKIAEDLARQVEKRFMAYLKENPLLESSGEAEVRSVLDRVRADVQAGLRTFMDSYGKEIAP